MYSIIWYSTIDIRKQREAGLPPEAPKRAPDRGPFSVLRGQGFPGQAKPRVVVPGPTILIVEV
jgi:hypothetical protein